MCWCRLERLELGFCGRGVSAEAVRALVGVAGGNATLPGLASLALKDAYRLEDADLHRLLAAAPNLERLRLANCSRLQDAARLAGLAPNLRRAAARSRCVLVVTDLDVVAYWQYCTAQACCADAGCWTLRSAGASAARRCRPA